MTMDITKITRDYTVKKLGEEDFPAILALYGSNPQYFSAMNQAVPEEGLEEDLEAVPAGKTLEDKYWLGFWQEEKLAATLELVTSYPEENTAYIGLFMMDAARQSQGEGSRLMADLFAWLKEGGFAWVELSYSYGNPQSERFWFKNGFFPTGAMRQMEDYVAISLQKHL